MESYLVRTFGVTGIDSEMSYATYRDTLQGKITNAGLILECKRLCS